MQQLVPCAVGIGAAQRQLLGQLLQRDGGVRRQNVRRNLPDQHRAAAEVLADEAELLQQRQVVQHGGIALRLQLHRFRRQQRLGHQGLAVGLQHVEPQPLVGGVLVDEPHGFVLVLADDVGFQHLAHHAPRRFLHRLHGLLFRLLRHGDGLLRRCFRYCDCLRFDGFFCQCLCLYRWCDLIGAARQGRGCYDGLLRLRHIPDVDRLGAVGPLGHGGHAVPDDVFRGRGGAFGQEATQRLFLLRRGGSLLLKLLRRHFPKKFRCIIGLFGGLFGV